MMTVKNLELLAQKEAVVATHVGIFQEATSIQTYERYQTETETFVAAPEILNYQRSFVNSIVENHTAIACLIAPFGFGKTSTAIYIWQACENANILAIPPFSCNSVTEMGQAIASAITYRLYSSGQDQAAKRIEEAFNEYLISSAQRLAKQDAERYQIDYEVALESIQDKIQSGHLQLEASGTHLVSFLEQALEIALQVGYRGLAIIVDEFQQFLGNINKAIITNFRTLIWGLRTRGDLPLGFLMTMDPDTERNLTDRGADILHRIRKDGLYLAFGNIYDREFPRELWSRYAESFDFITESARIVDNATLEAIGQICERDDLANGPRTVINVFQRIASLHPLRKRSYTPLDLINDFLTGDIRFDGDRGKIASLVNELTSYDYIKRIPKRVDTLRLMAAFPRGCPREVASYYNLADTYDQLIDELRGEILVELPEGVALIDLQKVGKPQNKLNIILKKYWMQITEEEIISDRALTLFAEFAVTPLFPPYVSWQNGWKGFASAFQLTPNGTYMQLYEGAFSEEYPQRMIAVQICSDINKVSQPSQFVDAHFIFLIQSRSSQNHELPKHLQGPSTFVFPIGLHQPFSRSLPKDIKDIETFLSPVVLTPGVLISLLKYIDEQAPQIEGITKQEQERIAMTTQKLQDFLLSMLFGSEVFAPYEINIYSRGAQAIRDALYSVLKRTYPHYQSLINGTSWQKLMGQLRDVLEQIDNPIRRGIEPLHDKKTRLAGLFAQRQLAGFESYVRQFGELLKVEDWRGDEGVLRFYRHPGEDILIEAISVKGELKKDEAYALTRSYGYLVGETDYLVDFLLLRGYVEEDKNEESLLPASTLSASELIQVGQDLIAELNLTLQSDNAAIIQQVKSCLISLEAKDTNISDIQVWLLQLQRQIQQQRTHIVKRMRDELDKQLNEIYRLKTRISEPLSEATSGLDLDRHINGAQRTTTAQRQEAVTRLDRKVQSIREQLAYRSDWESAELNEFVNYINLFEQQKNVAEEAIRTHQVLLEQAKLHENWVRLLGKMRRLYDSLPSAEQITPMDTLRGELDRLNRDAEQELASEGRQAYATTYHTLQGSLEQIERELDRLVHLANTPKFIPREVSPKEDLPPVKSQIHATQPTLALSVSPDGEVDLTTSFKQSGMSAETFLQNLIHLSREGKVSIQKRNLS